MRLAAEGFVFPEAPTWHQGLLWVSDVVAGGVTALDPAGQHVERRLDGRRGIGGMVSTEDGRLLASGRDLVDSETAATVLSRPAGSTGLNDVGTSADGSVLLGVLNYRPLAGDPAVPGAIGRWTGGDPDWAWATAITWPNGIAATRDGSIVAADYANGTLLLHAAGGGSPREICRSSSGHYDGLCVDDDDTVWAATGPGRTVERRSLAGDLLEEVTVPAGFVTSVCFSGDDPTALLITVAECSLASDGTGAVLEHTAGVTGRLPTPARVTSASQRP